MGKAVVTILLLIGVAHVAAILNLWYFAYPWIDIPMHFVGGAWAVVGVDEGGEQGGRMKAHHTVNTLGVAAP